MLREYLCGLVYWCDNRLLLFDNLYSISEHKLNQQHIAHRSSCNREEHFSFPEMQGYHYHYRYRFGNAMRSAEQRYIFQTVHHKHSEYRSGQRLAKILHILRRGLVWSKDKKRQKSSCHCSENTQGYGDDLLRNCHSHSASSFASMGFRSTVRKTTMHTIVGIIKCSDPNMIRHNSEAATPITDEMCCFSFSH